MANGGVHVIQTFFSETESEEIQIKGRTCRQDNPGSYELVVFIPDLWNLGVDNKNELTDFLGMRTDLSTKPVNEQWYSFLSEKRATTVQEKMGGMQKSMVSAKEKHDRTLKFIALLEQSGNSFIPNLEKMLRKINSEAMELLLSFNS